MPVWELLHLIGRSIPQAFLNIDFLLAALLVLMLIYGQYRRLAIIEIGLLGRPWTNPWTEMKTSLAFGFIGGVFASAVFIGVGIPLSEAGLWYVWPLALLLMLVHPRFLCFSYAGGLLALTNLLFDWPALNVSAMMALVAVLHMVEAALIYLSGHRAPSPIYLRQEGGEVVGGFTLQKFWPLPILALLLMAVSGELDGADMVSMPDWWPLIKPSQPLGQGDTFVYLLFPIIAALGYGDICLSRLPIQKAHLSAMYLATYSLLLLGAALGSVHLPILKWVAALGAPLGHELVIYLGRRGEMCAPPLFRSSEGAMILAVQRGSAAEQMGLVPGDVIQNVNGYPVSSGREVQEVMLPWIVDPVFTVTGTISGKGNREVSYKGTIPPLGVVFVPEADTPRALSLQSKGLLARWLEGRR